MTEPSGEDADPSPAGFAHASEAEMARILDFYAVRWEYEPHTFPILWNLEGDVVESFAPDFWLPDLELYLELTTLRQRLVRKKNRKLRRLRELYPDVRIKLFYARDFRALMLKYGKLALADALSGTPGQVPSHRRAAAAAAAAAETGVAPLVPPAVAPPRPEPAEVPTTAAAADRPAAVRPAGGDRPPRAGRSGAARRRRRRAAALERELAT